ncbi:Glyoxysomal fatty acid beta-oxidation multifunctional protein MFP-a isoform D [Glycine soja]|uniref:Glyoxysomal fatty acid beta-oxidation multifunctional protein MFP-a isoform D n=1 Tax=Glycine soja TaxID=3848 RepID=A0A445K145_GLYSO|nr:Glyoxysomal fatty acid beta-oxidation multifunctional protein MFP-a isoform D [Glycine soja]
MFFPYTQAGLLLVEHGADVYQIDRVITKFKIPMGPFRLVDLVGFGETTRKGFYLYDDKRKASPDPELKNYIQKARSFTGFSVDPKVLQSKHLILIFLLSWAWVFHLRGEVSYSGLTLLDPSTYVQD